MSVRGWRVGEHDVLVGDPERGACVDLPADAALAVLDPPWTEGIHNRSRARLGLLPVQDFTGMRRALLASAATARNAAVVMGFRYADQVVGEAIAAGMRLTSEVEVRYDSSNSCTLLVFGGPILEFDAVPTLTEALDCLVAQVGGPILDPWATGGLGALAAARAGCPSVSLDLSPTRALRLAQRLARITGATNEEV